MFKKEMYLGQNLNYAGMEITGPGKRDRVFLKNSEGKPVLALDGRERRNLAAQVHVPPGRYVVTKTSGTAPGDVGYWGYPE